MLRVYCTWPGVSAMMNVAPRRGEVAVGDVDRDALLALGAQAVGEQREVDVRRRRAALGGLRDLLELVLEDRLGVVEQAADQRGLAVVDRAGGGEAQQLARVPLGGVTVVATRPSEVALALAVLHRGLGDAVVGARLAALGDPRRGDLGDDVLERRAPSTRTAPVQRHVADGAVAHRRLERLLAVDQLDEVGDARRASRRARNTSRSCAK